MAATDLARDPARLVLLQDGADDIDFSACLEYQLAQVLDVGIGLGTRCVANGAVTPKWRASWPTCGPSLAQAIELLAPHTSTVAVLDYYQPIPAAVADRQGHGRIVAAHEPGLQRPQTQCASTYAAARSCCAALNAAIAGAVARRPRAITSRT